jgi:FkbM family methyltransferase
MADVASMQDGVIYDFGMNNGDDVEYYLLKGCKVVGVEANPALCREVERRFAAEIAEGRLVVLNAALSECDTGHTLDFYIHKTNHVLSQLAAPGADQRDDFERVQVNSRSAADVIREHGDPRYVKIDLEGMDAKVLRSIFGAGIYPPEISAESHSVDVFACLVEADYKAFSLVEGWSVSDVYGRTSIVTPDGSREFRFKSHSAGPFGEDIRSEWQDPDTFFYTLAAAGLGWKDIHASNVLRPAPAPPFRTLICRQAVALAKKAARGLRSRLARSG